MQGLTLTLPQFLNTYTHKNTPHSVGLLWTSDQPVAETRT